MQFKRTKVIGKWMADRGYDAWDIFINKTKWCRLVAGTKKLIAVMLEGHPFADIDWGSVIAKKLT